MSTHSGFILPGRHERLIGRAGRAGRARRAGRHWLLLALAAAQLAGCSSIQPWVKPYEREHFADPIMSFNRDPVSSSALEHVFETREGSRGASGGVGGGCGCN